MLFFISLSFQPEKRPKQPVSTLTLKHPKTMDVVRVRRTVMEFRGPVELFLNTNHVSQT